MNVGGVCVVVVDDDESMTGFLRRAFAGARSFSAFGSAEEFLASADLACCDIALVDVNMPGLDGISLTRHIREVAPQCDVMVMTGGATLDVALAALKAGAYDFLTKPFSVQQLEAAVDRCVERRAISSELRLIKAAQRELSAAYSQLQAAERMKEAFIAVIGHELRTPLTKVLGGVDLLRGAGEADRPALLDAVETGAHSLSETINQIILYADLRKERPPSATAALDLNAAALEVVAGLQGRAAEAGVALQAKSAPGPAVVHCDTELVKAAVRQLALNAVVFNRRGGSAEVAVRRGRGGFTVAVADTGIGIPAELVSGLGNPFYQVADHMTRRTGGLGLGLAIVKQVAEAHKGSVSVTAQPGGGTLFSLTLPAPGEGEAP